MKTTKFLALLTAFLLVFSLAACGTSKDNKKSEIADLIATEPGTKDEAAELHKKLMERENAILSKTAPFGRKCFSLPIKARR